MAALSKSTRRKIFYGMIALFAVVAPAVLLYSQGYLVDLKGRGLVATGGIFIKTVQAGARVFIDEEFSRETSFISHGALVTNLLPRRYALRVEKEGYRPWSKVVRVADAEVVEFRNVFLPPATITPSVVYRARAEGAARLVPLAGRAELGLEVGSPRSAAVFLVDPATRIAAINLIGVARWAWDEQSGTLTIGRLADGHYRWYRLRPAADGASREEPISFRGLPVDFSAELVVPHPEDPEQFYFFAGGALFLQGRSSVPIPIAERIHSFAVSPEYLYFVSKTGFFARSDLAGANTEVLGRKGLFLDDDDPARITIGPGGDAVAQDAARGLFLYQSGSDQEIELIAGNVNGFDFSQSGDRLLYWDDRRLWLYWLRDNLHQPFDLAKTKRQITAADSKIRSAYLTADGGHVVFATDQGIWLTEVDNRAGLNTYTLVDRAVNGLALDRENLIAYWLEGKTLYRGVLK